MPVFFLRLGVDFSLRFLVKCGQPEFPPTLNSLSPVMFAVKVINIVFFSIVPQLKN